MFLIRSLKLEHMKHMHKFAAHILIVIRKSNLTSFEVFKVFDLSETQSLESELTQQNPN